ncbi:helix-turn-helix domain-containing protein [Bifidobacterium adolescentis]|uniref:helix-turn-helix domain-containing protein n=1 Tax=Bifidobacterium adolescentis TaxID=1680 RepID=UPI0022E08372|nr:helix-turn-helix transcriptional regulator [Bifidobacterium adolescentis]
MTNKEIAAKINTLRKEANLTQVNFGNEVIHVSQATASKKLNGQIPFSVEEIFECAERFNVSIEYLYGREKKKTLEPV